VVFDLFSPRLFRPPAEADSMIVRVAQGCPHNTCVFCGMYKGVAYRPAPLEQMLRQVRKAVRGEPDARRVFLADGDVMALEFAALRDVLAALNAGLPELTRVSVYANGSSILAKTDEQLTELRTLKLHTLYMGLETGDDSILREMEKSEVVSDMVEAGRRAQACGLRMSVMVLLGLGGQQRSETHAAATAEAINRMQPRLLSVLRLVPTENTPLWRRIKAGTFTPVTEYEAVCELRRLIAGLELQSTVFRANHVSNVLPLEGRLPRDKAGLLALLDGLLNSDTLDRNSPGVTPLWL